MILLLVLNDVHDGVFAESVIMYCSFIGRVSTFFLQGFLDLEAVPHPERQRCLKMRMAYNLSSHGRLWPHGHIKHFIFIALR